MAGSSATFFCCYLRQKAIMCTTPCTCAQVYNEEISDLLQPNNSGLQIRDGDLSRGIYVDRLAERSVLNADGDSAASKTAASHAVLCSLL